MIIKMVRNNLKKEIILIGGGGHCNSCIDVIETENKFSIKGIIDNNLTKNNKILGYAILGSDNDFLNFNLQNKNFLITVGQISNNKIRANLYNNYKNKGAKFPTIISKNAYISEHSIIKGGTIVMNNAILNSNSKISENCIINTRALVEHDAIIESNCHLSTGVIVNGGSKVGSGTFIGSGSIIFENVKIGQNCIIAAGSIVSRNIPKNTFFKRK